MVDLKIRKIWESGKHGVWDIIKKEKVPVFSMKTVLKSRKNGLIM